MVRVSTDILGISELKQTEMGEFNSDDHYIYYCGQESLRRNEVAHLVNKKVQNAVIGCNLKNNRMVSVRFQGKPFNITVFQDYGPTTNAEEAKWFYDDLQDLLQLKKKKKWCPFHPRGLECKSRKSRDIWSNSQVWPRSTEWSRSKSNRVLPTEHTGHRKYPLPTAQLSNSTHGHPQMVNTEISWLYSLQPKMEKLYIVSRNKIKKWLWLRSWTTYCQIQT